MPARENFSFDLGEHWPILLTCYEDQAQSQVMDLTGAQRLELRLKRGATEVLVDLASGAQIQSPASAGVAFIVVTPAKQAGLAPASYAYTVRVTKADGVVSDQLCGVITVRQTEFGA